MEKIKSHFTQHGIHYAAVLLFYALAAMFFSKSFDGYVVRQGDIERFHWDEQGGEGFAGAF